MTMRFSRIFSISLLSQGIVIFIGFVNSVIVTRQLGVDGRGQYAIAMNIVTVLALLLADGLYRSNTYLVSVARKNLSSLFANGTLAIVLASGLFLALPSLLGKETMAFLLPGIGSRLVLLSVLCVAPVMLLRTLEGLVLGLQRYIVFNGIVVAPLLLFLIANMGLYAFDLITPESVMIGYLASMTIALATALIWLLLNEEIRFAPDRAVARQSLSKGFKAGISTISLYMLFRVDIFLVNYFLGVELAGLYSISVLVAELLQKLANTSGTVLFPRVSGKPTEQNRKLSLKVLALVLGVGIVFAAGVLLFGKALIVLLYGKEFALAAVPMAILLPGTVIMAGGKIALFALWGQGFPAITFLVPFAAFVLNTVLCVVLIPAMGTSGAALSTTISYTLFGIILGGYYLRKGKVPAREPFSETPVAE